MGFQVSNTSLIGNIEKIIRSSDDGFHVITNSRIYKGSHSSNALLSWDLPQNFNNEKLIDFRGDKGYALTTTNPVTLLKTTNSGNNWTIVNNDIGLNQGNVTSIDLNGDNIIINSREKTNIDPLEIQIRRYSKGFYSVDEGVTMKPLGLVNKNANYYTSECQIVGNLCYCFSGNSIIKLDLTTL